MPSTIEFGSHWYAESTGSANAYVVSLSPSLGEISTGLVIYMKANFTNTDSATVNVDGLGAKAIKKMDGSNLLEEDIPLNSIAHIIYDGTNFQLASVSPSASEELINQNTSNNFRTLDAVQGSHAGAIQIERGWVDSFGTANEIGADEASSTEESHDNVNKLYKGVPAGTNLNSDKDYTTESNYLQQEWTNSNQNTSQATVATDTTVTLSSGTWPTNAANGRISFDSGSTFFDIASRDSSTALTLETSATNGTSDYIIRMSEFISESVQLNEIDKAFDIGDGRDGSVTITTSKNINSDILGSIRSTNADGISTTVTANPTGTSITVSSITGFADGDKLLLINLQGSSGDTADVGNFEILTVNGTPSGSIITLEETISKSYDGSSFASQKIVCQRIPQWTNVNINAGGDLTCNAWNGSQGGVLIFFATGTVTVTSGRTINADSKGYRGGVKSMTNGVIANQGESRPGTGSASRNANDGGGGGAQAENGDGGGGGYGTAGATGDTAAPKEGFGGGTYGGTSLTSLYMGSGGGGGAYTIAATDGAPGAGIIFISANAVSISGNITSKGGTSATSSSGQYTEGGGGAGGSILIRTNTLTTTSDSIDANGGRAPSGINKSLGGDGRIRLEYSTIDGQSFPDSTEENDACDPDPGTTALPGLPNTNVIAEYVSVSDTFVQKVNTSSWLDINSSSRTETLNSQNAYYWLSYDPASSYGNGTEVKIFNQTGSVWRKIAQNNAGTWQYNNDATSTSTENWVNATTNDMLHAVSQAMSSQANNRMTGADLAAITDGEWEAANGFSTSVDSLARGVTLHSTSSSQNPSVDQYRISYDSDIASMDLRSKTFDPGASPAKAFVWAIVEHTAPDGAGTFSVSRNGGTDWETVTMVQQGEAISGDIRILRSVHTFTTGASGEDLRARYVTVIGESQKLHAWGLQSRD